MLRTRTFIWATIPELIGFLLLGMASHCPSAAAEEIRRLADHGIPIDEPILIQIPGRLLRVPAGYLSHWPTNDMRNRINVRPSVEFVFWMPTRRHVESSPISLTSMRPREPGRDEPPSDASLVYARNLRLLPPDKLGHRSPTWQFGNLSKNIGPLLFEEEFGLLRFWQKDWPHSQPQAFLNYRHIEGSDPQLQLRCTPPHRNPDGICDGEVYFVADNIIFRLVMLRDNLPRWRENVDAVRDLLNSWTVADGTAAPAQSGSAGPAQR